MECPVCKKRTFVAVQLLEDLQALKCEECGGHWIKSFQYWRWRDRNKEILPEKETKLELIAEDKNEFKTCPECFKNLTKYSVGHGTGFTIDQCGVCRGIWFDKNEWEILKDKNLHDEIHFIFSAHWQKAAREEQYEINRENRLKDLIGESDFVKSKEFKDWLKKHDEKVQILGYLNN